MDICKNCGVSGGTHACNPKDVINRNLRVTIEQLRAKVSELESSHTRLLLDNSKKLAMVLDRGNQIAELQAQVDAIYALPVVAYEDELGLLYQDFGGNSTPLVKLPPRGGA